MSERLYDSGRGRQIRTRSASQRRPDSATESANHDRSRSGHRNTNSLSPTVAYGARTPASGSGGETHHSSNSSTSTVINAADDTLILASSGDNTVSPEFLAPNAPLPPLPQPPPYNGAYAAALSSMVSLPTQYHSSGSSTSQGQSISSTSPQHGSQLNAVAPAFVPASLGLTPAAFAAPPMQPLSTTTVTVPLEPVVPLYRSDAMLPTYSQVQFTAALQPTLHPIFTVPATAASSVEITPYMGSAPPERDASVIFSPAPYRYGTFQQPNNLFPTPVATTGNHQPSLNLCSSPIPPASYAVATPQQMAPLIQPNPSLALTPIPHSTTECIMPLITQVMSLRPSASPGYLGLPMSPAIHPVSAPLTTAPHSTGQQTTPVAAVRPTPMAYPLNWTGVKAGRSTAIPMGYPGHPMSVNGQPQSTQQLRSAASTTYTVPITTVPVSALPPPPQPLTRHRLLCEQYGIPFGLAYGHGATIFNEHDPAEVTVGERVPTPHPRLTVATESVPDLEAMSTLSTSTTSDPSPRPRDRYTHVFREWANTPSPAQSPYSPGPAPQHDRTPSPRAPPPRPPPPRRPAPTVPPRPSGPPPPPPHRAAPPPPRSEPYYSQPPRNQGRGPRTPPGYPSSPPRPCGPQTPPPQSNASPPPRYYDQPPPNQGRGPRTPPRYPNPPPPTGPPPNTSAPQYPPRPPTPRYDQRGPPPGYSYQRPQGSPPPGYFSQPPPGEPPPAYTYPPPPQPDAVPQYPPTNPFAQQSVVHVPPPATDIVITGLNALAQSVQQQQQLALEQQRLQLEQQRLTLAHAQQQRENQQRHDVPGPSVVPKDRHIKPNLVATTPKFSGEDTQTFVNWLPRFQKDAQSDDPNYTPHVRLHWLCGKLTAEAARAYDVIEKANPNIGYEEMVQCLRERFAVHLTPQQHLSEFGQIRQNQGETVRQFVDRLMTYYNDHIQGLTAITAEFKEQSIQQQLIQGFIPVLRQQINLNPRPSSSIIHDALQAEDVLRQLNVIKPREDRSNNNNSQRSDRTDQSKGKKPNNNSNNSDNNVSSSTGGSGHHGASANYCTFCEKTGHARAGCSKRTKHLARHGPMVVNQANEPAPEALAHARLEARQLGRGTSSGTPNNRGGGNRAPSGASANPPANSPQAPIRPPKHLCDGCGRWGTHRYEQCRVVIARHNNAGAGPSAGYTPPVRQRGNDGSNPYSNSNNAGYGDNSGYNNNGGYNNNNGGNHNNSGYNSNNSSPRGGGGNRGRGRGGRGRGGNGNHGVTQRLNAEGQLQTQQLSSAAAFMVPQQQQQGPPFHYPSPYHQQQLQQQLQFQPQQPPHQQPQHQPAQQQQPDSTYQGPPAANASVMTAQQAVPPAPDSSGLPCCMQNPGPQPDVALATPAGTYAFIQTAAGFSSGNNSRPAGIPLADLRYYTDVFIDRHSTKALVDTGAQLSLMTRSLYERCYAAQYRLQPSDVVATGFATSLNVQFDGQLLLWAIV